MSRFKHKLRMKAAKFIEGLGIESIYGSYSLDENEHFFTINERDIDSTVPDLFEKWGYEYQLLGARKLHPQTENPDSGSWRRVPNEHPNKDNRLTRNWEPNQCQYHMHYWKIDSRIEFYIHYELRPDIFKPSINTDRLQEHYKPTWDVLDKDDATYLLGQTDPEVIDWIHNNEVKAEGKP